MTDEPACRHVPYPELFFPIGWGEAFKGQIEAAKSVCRACSVLDACRQYTRDHPTLTREGIWAGTTPDERREERRRQPPPEATPNGTSTCHECRRAVRLRADKSLAPHSVHPGQPSTVVTCPGSRRRPRQVAT